MARSSAEISILLSDIEELLVAEAPKAVRRGTRGWRSPPWSCALVFDGSMPAQLPPEIALTNVAERDAYLRSARKPDRKHIWNCVAFEGIGAGWFADRKLLSACRAANAVLEDHGPVRRLVVGVARRLNALPVESFGDVASEFVVYAFDRNEPATKLLAGSLPAKKRAALDRLRLL